MYVDYEHMSFMKCSCDITTHTTKVVEAFFFIFTHLN